MKKIFIIALIGIFTITLIPNSYSTTGVINEDNISTSITYPEGIVRGSDFNITFIIQNTGSYERKNVTMGLDYQQKIFSAHNEIDYLFERIADHSSYGKSFSMKSLPESTLGQQFINIELSHIDSINKIRHYSLALPIQIIEEPKVVIKTIVSESIYSNAEFPFIVEIESQGSNLKDVSIKITPPNEITFRGQTLHTFSSIDKDTPISLRSELITADGKDVGYEHYIPFQITVEYTDETNTERETSKTISVLLRPKTLFEFGAEGGFWIGKFYFTPTISIGALIGITTGGYGFYKWYKKRMKNQ